MNIFQNSGNFLYKIVTSAILRLGGWDLGAIIKIFVMVKSYQPTNGITTDRDVSVMERRF